MVFLFFLQLASSGLLHCALMVHELHLYMVHTPLHTMSLYHDNTYTSKKKGTRDRGTQLVRKYYRRLIYGAPLKREIPGEIACMHEKREG